MKIVWLWPVTHYGLWSVVPRIRYDDIIPMLWCELWYNTPLINITDNISFLFTILHCLIFIFFIFFHFFFFFTEWFDGKCLFYILKGMYVFFHIFTVKYNFLVEFFFHPQVIVVGTSWYILCKRFIGTFFGITIWYFLSLAARF